MLSTQLWPACASGSKPHSLLAWDTWQRSAQPLRQLELTSTPPATIESHPGAIYFRLDEPPAEPLLKFPRLHVPVRSVWYWNEELAAQTSKPGEASSATQATDLAPFVPPREVMLQLTQSPVEWKIALPANAKYPLVVVMDVIGTPASPAELPVLGAGADGTIVLPACRGRVSGEKLQFEPLLHKNTVGYWVNPADFVQWDFGVATGGVFQLHVLQGCGAGQGGSRVRFTIGQQTLDYTVEATGHFQNFRWRAVGQVELSADRPHQLTVACEQLARAAVMDIREIRLVPQVESTTMAPRMLQVVSPDVHLPALSNGPATAGKRVLEQLATSATKSSPANGEPYHVVGLPTDWQAGKSYPLLVELAGNGPYKNLLGDFNSGRVEDGELSWGLSGGDGWITLAVPFLNDAGDQAVVKWWGDPPAHDPQATITYLERAVDQVCQRYGADPQRIVLTGFSRGSLACSYIGLANDQVAKRWRGLLCYSHVDGVREWPYPNSDAQAAAVRWRRFAARPVLIMHESGGLTGPTQAQTEQFLESQQLGQGITLQQTQFLNHDDAWTLRPSPARQHARKWLAEVVETAQRDDSL
ncbi:hypothetical protein SH139x_001746 [Planctomycetaceae bacterium SH139]